MAGAGSSADMASQRLRMVGLFSLSVSCSAAGIANWLALTKGQAKKMGVWVSTDKAMKEWANTAQIWMFLTHYDVHIGA